MQYLVAVVGERARRDHLDRVKAGSVGHVHERNAGLRVTPRAHPPLHGDGNVLGCLARENIGAIECNHPQPLCNDKRYAIRRPCGYSAVAPDSRTTSFHFSYSRCTNWPNSAGVPPTGSAPCAIICFSIEGMARISFTALLSWATTGSGVPFGAKKPNHEPASKPGKPLSIPVGTSGNERDRFALLMAMGINLPP